jgi:uncharacterized protein YrrD
MDEGAPIAYRVLEHDVPVFASDGIEVGKVHHVVAAPEKDIFHGIVITTGVLKHSFVPADQVAALHEHGVDLRIDAAEAERLPAPGGSAPVYDEDPGSQTKWSHLINRLALRKDWTRED